MGHAFRSKGIAEERIEQPHIQFALAFTCQRGWRKSWSSPEIPCDVGSQAKVFEDGRVAVRDESDAQGTQKSRGAGQVEGGLEAAVERAARAASREAQIGGAGLDVIALRECGWAGAAGHAAGKRRLASKVERGERFWKSKAAARSS